MLTPYFIRVYAYLATLYLFITDTIIYFIVMPIKIQWKKLICFISFYTFAGLKSQSKVETIQMYASLDPQHIWP